jgi:hypothetical protein
MLNGAVLVPHKLANRLIDLDENEAKVAVGVWDMTTGGRETMKRPGQVRVSNLIDQRNTGASSNHDLRSPVIMPGAHGVFRARGVRSFSGPIAFDPMKAAS